LVTVVLATHNGSPWISDQLAAITSQNLVMPFEVVVSDNGSTDDTIERCRAFVDLAEPQTRIVDAGERPGQSFAQRLGVLAARGQLIVFADDDDVAAPGWLQGLVDASTEFDMVGGPLDISSLNVPATIDARGRRWLEGLMHGLPESPGTNLAYAIGANSAIWRSVFLEIDEPENDLPPEASSVDRDLMFRLRRAGGSVGFAPGAVMAYRLRGDGRALRRQVRKHGLCDAAMVQRYRDLGASGDSLRAALRKWAFIAPRAAKAALERDQLHWARAQLAFAVGRLEGSVRFRVVCL